MDINVNNKKKSTLVNTNTTVKTAVEIQNKTQNQYALTNGGPTKNNVSNTTTLNLVPNIPDMIKIDVFVRNKSMNGEFVKNLSVLVNSEVEVKMIITNISQSPRNLGYPTAKVMFDLSYFEFVLGTESTNIGSISFLQSELSWTNSFLQLGTTAYAMGTIKAINLGTSILSAIGTYTPYETTQFNTRTVNFSAPTINVIDPSVLKIEKFQRIPLLNNAIFTKYPLEVLNTEIIEYKITATNTSNQVLTSIIVKDVLKNNLSYIQDSIVAPNGTTATWKNEGSSIVNGKTVGGTIEWNISLLNINSTATLIFRAEGVVS